MNCRDFENEFEADSALGSAANLHVESCQGCSDFMLGQTRVSELLGQLYRVETPKDFDFKLQAKIARRKSGVSGTGLFPSWRLVLPLGFAVVFISILAFSGLYFIDLNHADRAAINGGNAPVDGIDLNSTAQIPANSVSESKNPPSDSRPNDQMTESALVQGSVTEVAENKVNKRNARLNSRTRSVSENDAGGGSRDSALTSQPMLIQPEFDSNRKINTSVNPSGPIVSDLSEILKIIGVSLDSLTVTSVGKNSIAERSGIKTGDIVDAVNGKKIGGQSSDFDQGSVTTLTIVRDGLKKEVSLINR